METEVRKLPQRRKGYGPQYDKRKVPKRGHNMGAARIKIFPTNGNAHAPQDFEEWPIVDVKAGEFWELHYRREDYPLMLQIGKRMM